MPECDNCGDDADPAATRLCEDDLLQWCEECYGKLYHHVTTPPGEWVGWDSGGIQ